MNPSALPPDVLAYGASGYRGYGFCATADLPSQGLLSYVVKCQATPCCSSSGWIVTLSIILSFSASEHIPRSVCLFRLPTPLASLLRPPPSARPTPPPPPPPSLPRAAVIGLVGYWVWADRQAILKKKRDQTALAASIADASAKAAKVVGSATSTDSVHGGYNSL